MRHEISCLDANRGLQVQPTDDSRDIQAVFRGELSWAQAVVAIGAGAVMLRAERDRRRIGGLLADSVWASVRRFDASPRPADTTGLCANPGKIARIASRFHDSGTSPAHSRSQCRQAGQASGNARLLSLTAKQRSAIARKAALARWGK